MRNEELEAWILRIAEQAKAKKSNEDSRVELKGAWPEPTKAARRLAGQANCARPSSILWIIGIDEKAGLIVGAKHQDLASWWPQTQKEFPELAPELLSDLAVPVDGQVVVGLLFDTSRAPFVVKNPSHGQAGHPAQLEVPWSEGTLTRSARRQDLIRLLVPREALPDVEVLQAELSGRQFQHEGRPATEWHLKMILYLAPSDRPVVFPFHRMQAFARFEGQDQRIDLGDLRFVSPWPDSDLPHAQITAADLTLTGASLARLEGSGLNESAISAAELVTIRATLQPARFDDTLTIEPTEQLVRTSDPAHWLFHARGSPIWADLPQRHPLESTADKLDRIRELWQLNPRRPAKLGQLAAEIEQVLVDALSALPTSGHEGIRNVVGNLYDRVQHLREQLDQCARTGGISSGIPTGIRQTAHDEGLLVLGKAGELRQQGKNLREH